VDADTLKSRIRACRLCAGDFAATRTAHTPRPVAWFRPGARLLIAGQAPGMRVHESGVPFDDRSGDRLRDWLGLSRDAFYDKDRVAIVPMAFCFPGYDARGSDLPPPRRCAETWRAAVMAQLPRLATTVVIGGHAQRWHLGPQAARTGVVETLRNWRAHAPGTFVLPHPSWRNTTVLRRNPWIETEIVPALRQRVGEIL
jgi:uracil-DNA glycosylase